MQQRVEKDTTAGRSLMRRVRRNKDIGIKGINAKIYDRQGRRYRQQEFRAQAEELAARIKENDRVLEVAVGSGYLAVELYRLGRKRITGMDISEDQVEIARTNARSAGAEVELVVANVRKIPFADSSFECVLCFAAFKNFQDPSGALEEMRRVLVPGGTVIIGDMFSDISNAAIDEYLDGQNIRGVQRFFLARTFRFLRKGAYSHDELGGLIDQAGFASHELEEGGIGFSLRLTK